MWQANFVKRLIEEEYGDLTVKIVIIKTTGDKVTKTPLADIGGKALFLKEIEEALLAKKIDLGVHSMKDVPCDLPRGLVIGAILQREDPRDVFISKKYRSLFSLPKRAQIGTSSLRRKAQLKNFRPDLEIVPLRGNLETRLKKLHSAHLSAIVLASAGMTRLGLVSKISEYLPTSLMLPAVGQGAIGVEIRSGDSRVKKLIRILNHPSTEIAVTAERSFLRVLEGGCHTPIGGYAEVMDSTLRLTGMVASLDGRQLLRDQAEGNIRDAARIGEELGKRLLSQGARSLLKECQRK